MICNLTKDNIKWRTCKLSELGIFNRGVSKHRPRNDKRLFIDGKYPFVQTSDIKNANLYIYDCSAKYGELGLKQSKLWNKGTLCITIAANVADTAILGTEMCFPDSIVGFNAYEKITTEEFVYYIFSYINEYIKRISHGSTQDNINIDYLSTLEFKIPELNYQNKIVHLLKSIDERININNKINDNLFDYDMVAWPLISKGSKNSLIFLRLMFSQSLFIINFLIEYA